jgi:hypothetical protein
MDERGLYGPVLASGLAIWSWTGAGRIWGRLGAGQAFRWRVPLCTGRAFLGADRVLNRIVERLVRFAASLDRPGRWIEA